jgi:hypothetical protein
MDRYAQGDVIAEDIDDYVDLWHNDAPTRDGRVVSLGDFLGMTRGEYEAWVHDDSALPHILQARISGASAGRGKAAE